MPVKPKHNITLNDKKPIANKKFTNRETYIETFKKHLLSENRKNAKVIVFYGIGGIGKSTLKRELCRILDEDYADIIWSQLDFELQSFREQENSLYHLRKNLRKEYKIVFPTFDIAYALYWQKTHPQLTIAKDNIPLLDDGTIISDLLSNAGGIPVVGLLPSIAKAVFRGQKVFKNWWTKRGQKELYDLPSLSPKEILDRLPMYFALDLKDYLQTNTKNAVIFLDTYEGLWENNNTEGSFFLRDEWLRELVAQLPEILWVILGREKLRWNELDNEWENQLEQHLLGGMSETDSTRFLQSCGITNENILKVIVSSSKGVPYYLDLAADTYFQIKQKYNREPYADDFAKAQQEVLNRFLRYLDRSEIETLKVLSVPQYWNQQIFKFLIDEYKTGYPVSAMNNLNRFSFVDRINESNTFVLHNLMRRGLNLQLEKGMSVTINKSLLGFYEKSMLCNNRKEITDENCSALNEAFYHAKHSLEYKELYKWFYNIFDSFDKAAKWNILSKLNEELIDIIDKRAGKNNVEYSMSVMYFSSLLYNLGIYGRALKLIEDSFDTLKNTLGENNSKFSSILNNLATMYYYRGEVQKSKKLYERVIEIRKNTTGENNPAYADVIDNLGVIFNDLGQHDKAIELHKKAAEIYKNTLGENHVHYADALNNLATSYLDLKKYDESIELFKKALDIVVNDVGENHPRFAAAMNHIGRVYFEKGENDSALIYYQKAFEIRKELLGDNHPLTGCTLSNTGQVYERMGNYKQAIELQEKAADIFKNTVGEKHLYFADSAKYLGENYKHLGEIEIALKYFMLAENLYIQNFGKLHSAVVEVQKQIKSLTTRINSSS